ncbi:MAG TPA: hypothetical protein PKK48_01350 [Phycisphaerae bacterium]|mgnify:CR=1 FL=1|nr:hypothetical protein [Phycisphaerae bacterium]HPS53625.1 hypothetical protein [Phycisphaerae bacterium]
MGKNRLPAIGMCVASRFSGCRNKANRIQLFYLDVESQMTRNKYLLAEKIVVYGAAAAMAAVIYFAFAPLILPVDPTGPIAPLLTGEFGYEILLVSVLLAAGLAFAAGGVLVRPGSFSLVLLAGMAGVSMKSGMFRVVLWQKGTDLGIWVCMLAELLILAAAMLIVDFAASLFRRRAIRRGGFTALSARLSDEQLASLAEDKLILPERQMLWSRDVLPNMAVENHFLSLLLLLCGLNRFKSSHRTLAVMALKNAAGFTVVGMAVGLVAAYVLAGSVARGQLVFAAFGAFWLAAEAGYYLYPVPDSFPAWLLPVMVGAAYYVIAMFTSSDLNPDQWTKLKNVFQILPVDWIFAGGAGAMFSLWSSDRSKEVRIIEKLDIQE